MSLRDDLDRIAQAAGAFAGEGEELAGVIATEPSAGERGYLCAFRRGEEDSWLLLDADGAPVADRRAIRDAAAIAALCELAEENAGGGELDELRERLVAIRMTENPEGIEEAEEAALALQHALGAPPRLAEPGYLDRVGAATRRLELALGGPAESPFAHAMQAGTAAVEEFTRDVESRYKLALAERA